MQARSRDVEQLQLAAARWECEQRPTPKGPTAGPPVRVSDVVDAVSELHRILEADDELKTLGGVHQT